MKNKLIKTTLILFAFVIMGCTHQKKYTVITPKIQYDVNIKTPDPTYDWWIQNISGQEREQLTLQILNGALSGKYMAYDYFYQPISPQKIAGILNDSLIKKIYDKNPPYTLIDTLIVHKITSKDILRLRFLEEWEINNNDLSFIKKVKGIAPIAKITDASGTVRWQPLFWIFPDKKFVKHLQNIQNQKEGSTNP